MVVVVHGDPIPIMVKEIKLFEAADKAVCPYIVNEDFSENRTPEVIKEIICLSEEPIKSLGANYICKQLTDEIKIHHYEILNHATGEIQDEKYSRKVNVGCVYVRINNTGNAEKFSMPVV